MHNSLRWTGSCKPLTNWDALLANCGAKAEQLLHFQRVAPVNMMNGNTFRLTQEYYNIATLRLSFAMLSTVSITGSVLFITEEGLAHIGILNDRTEQIYYELPSVWQYHDREGDDALSVPLGREQEVPFMYAMA